MNKNISVLVLVILLVASIVWAWTLKEGNAKLVSEKTALQTKIDKSLAYAESLDILFDPGRAQAGLSTRYNLSETETLTKLTDKVQATGDSELQTTLNTLKAGGAGATAASVHFMEYAVSAIVDTLK
jgi:hypothetical protein